MKTRNYYLMIYFFISTHIWCSLCKKKLMLNKPEKKNKIKDKLNNTINVYKDILNYTFKKYFISIYCQKLIIVAFFYVWFNYHFIFSKLTRWHEHSIWLTSSRNFLALQPHSESSLSLLIYNLPCLQGKDLGRPSSQVRQAWQLIYGTKFRKIPVQYEQLFIHCQSLKKALKQQKKYWILFLFLFFVFFRKIWQNFAPQCPFFMFLTFTISQGGRGVPLFSFLYF